MIIWLAPMDGVTDAACRWITETIFEQYNSDTENELFLWTEFMNVNWYLINPHKLVKHLFTIDSDTPTIAQIYGGDVDLLIKASLDIQQNYPWFFHGIELNIGCPSPRVMAWGAGSGMLRDKKRTIQIIQNLRKNIDGFFSIKTRSGLNKNDEKEQFDFILEASRFCDMITIHGRNLKQSHSWEVDRNFIFEAKKLAEKNCQIVGNWGINNDNILDTIWEAKKHNLDGVMIGQSAIWNPRVLSQHKPSLEDRHNTILEHLETSMACEYFYKKQVRIFESKSKKSRWHFVVNMLDKNELQNQRKLAISDKDFYFRSVIEFRKFLFNYVKGISNSKEFKVAVSRKDNYQDLKNEVDKFFELKSGL